MSFQQLLKTLGDPKLIKFLRALDKMEKMEYYIGDFTFKGHTWKALLVRDAKKKDSK